MAKVNPYTVQLVYGASKPLDIVETVRGQGILVRVL